jgi:MFS family permease
MLISVFLILTAPTLILNYLGIYLANSFDVPQVNIGAIYTIAAIGTVLGTFFSGVFSDRIGKYKLSKILFIGMLIAIIPIPFVRSLILIVLLSILFSFGLDGGWTSYQALATEVVPEKKGTFMSLFYTVNAITITFYSLVGPILYRLGGFPLLVIIASVFLTIALYIIMNLKIKE